MKLKSTLFLLLFNVSSSLFAQTSSPNSFAKFYSIDNTSLVCGGNVIIGHLYDDNNFNQTPNGTFIYGEDNKFFLEIATENSSNYIKIQAQKIDIAVSGKAQFLLPDTLKIGRNYLLRMSSTNPALVSRTPYKLKFGIGLVPYTVNFSQEKDFFQSSPQVSLSYEINLKSGSGATNLYIENGIGYQIKTSNGINDSIYTYNLPTNAGFSVVPQDSVNVYRLTEIVNSCRTKGEIIGEAKVTRKEFIDMLNVSLSANVPTVCDGSKLSIDVTSKSLTSKTTFEVEFSKDYDFTSGVVSTNATLTHNNKIVVSLPSIVKTGEYVYFRVKTEAPKMVSKILFIYATEKTTSVIPRLIQDTADELYISFEQYNANNINHTTYLSQVIVNGKDISNEINGAIWRFPFPKKDTVLTFSKISNSCGNLSITNPSVSIKAENFIFINFQNKLEATCQGKTTEISYTISNPIKANDVAFYAYISANGLEYVQVDNSFSGAYVTAYVYNLKTLINQDKKTVSVTIPSDLDEQLQKQFGNRRVNIQELSLKMYAYRSGNSSLSVGSNFSSSPLKLIPKLTLTAPKIEVDGGGGYVDIPVKFTGGSAISYTLSNGQTGVINHQRSTCYSCQPLNGGETSIRVLAEQNSLIRIVTAENTCALASLTGETSIIVNTDRPALLIDESKTAKRACKGSTINVTFQKLGKWSSEPNLRLQTKVYYYGNGSYDLSPQVITGSTVSIIASNKVYDAKMEVWVEAIGTNVKSNSIIIDLEKLPYGFKINASTNDKSVAYTNNVETIYLLNSTDANLSFSGYGGNLDFTIDGKKITNIYKSGNYSETSIALNRKSDSLFTINSFSNICGLVELNRKVKVVRVPTILTGNDKTTEEYFIKKSQCVGTKRIITFSYLGLAPSKDSLVVQLAKYDDIDSIDFTKLSFFDVPAIRRDGSLTFTIPDTLFGYYAYRVKSLVNNLTSNINYDGYDYYFYQKPNVKLSTATGKDVIGLPSANLYLISNFEKSTDFSIIMNDGTKHNSYNFGLYYDAFLDNNGSVQRKVKNLGKEFQPNQTTTYSLKSAYNICGLGTVEGNATINIPPSIKNQISASTISQAFCSGDSLTIDLSYLGAFPTDTLMGIYLHSYTKSSVNQELISFKNKPNKISVKLPSDVNSGYYYIQTRKKSRSKIYTKGYFYELDSLTKTNAKLNLDAEPITISITTPLMLNLSGNSEIFVGDSTNLTIKLLNQKGEDPKISQDTISFIYGVTNYFTLSDGNTYSSNYSSLIVSPLKTETFTITNTKNACGVGKATGNATVVVYPKSDKRIKTIGYSRKRSENSSYLEDYLYACSGTKDSLDIRLFGIDSKSDFSKYKVLLSDKDGKNYAPIKTTKFKLSSDLEEYKILRLWYELPESVVAGTNYLIKGVADDANIISTPLNTPGIINELPTASLTGNTQFTNGDKVNAVVKLTGNAPWAISVIDKDGNFAYNGLPTKIDSTENFKNYKPKLIYTNEFNLELNPKKSNVYRISKVFNEACEFGKVIAGEFTVDLILANENPIQNLIQIYPNPTANQLNIDLTSLNTTTVVATYNSMGKLLDSRTYTQSQTQHKQSLDFSQYNSGVYLIKVNTDKLSQTYRIVKH